MCNECIYCAVNMDDEIQWVWGSSKKTRYFKTDRYLKQAVANHNQYNLSDKWRIAKFKLVEVDYGEQQ